MAQTLTVERIKSALHKLFDRKIDMSDWVGKDSENVENAFLSRAIAAYCLTSLTETEPDVLGAAVTDGFQDGGIDLAYFDAEDRRFYLVASKLGPLDRDDSLNLIHGVEEFIKAEFSGFNNKIKSRQAEFCALLERSDVNIVLVLVTLSPQPIVPSASGPITTFMASENNVGDTEVFSLEVFNLERLYAILTGTSTSRVDLQICLTEWGRVEAPFGAYYGQVKASEIARWASHGKSLFARNIRYYKSSTDVNEAMEATIKQEPSRFWYYNNGITVLCTKIQKTVKNGTAREFGFFDCEAV